MTHPAPVEQDTQIFFDDIALLLKNARQQSYRAVNTIMTQTYWHIGKRIIQQEQQGQVRANYGDYLITNLSRHLTDIFGKGFSEANLWNMCQFYKIFPDFTQFSTQCVGNLSWSNIRLIMRLLACRLFLSRDCSFRKYSSNAAHALSLLGLLWGY